jgi:hypothetical protein
MGIYKVGNGECAENREQRTEKKEQRTKRS